GQLIFNVGIMIGFYWQELQARFSLINAGRRRLIKRAFAFAAVLTFAASYASIYLLNLLNWLWGRGSLSSFWAHVTWTWDRLNYDVWVYADKWTMGPLRIILFFIWFPALYWLCRRYESKINHYTRGLIELLGQNSLLVYTIEAFIVFIFKIYLIPSKTGFFENFTITTSSIVVLVGLTVLYKKLRARTNFAQLGSKVIKTFKQLA
ncbi:OpgC domain-containing protein, partial [Candidatus Saccharibacteria bacterium]|nr:OpgC domain-containing protein [Candidatus Saccharibacteria bacterium]